MLAYRAVAELQTFFCIRILFAHNQSLMRTTLLTFYLITKHSIIFMTKSLLIKQLKNVFLLSILLSRNCHVLY